MTRTFAAAAIALMLASPAFAEGTSSNNGLPEEAVAVGQVNYQFDVFGHLAKQDVATQQQFAAAPSAAPQTANADDGLLANHDYENGRQ